jgi:hypothetical protein
VPDSPDYEAMSNAQLQAELERLGNDIQYQQDNPSSDEAADLARENALRGLASRPGEFAPESDAVAELHERRDEVRRILNERWRRTSDARHRAEGLDTGHYDDGHSFGRERPADGESGWTLPGEHTPSGTAGDQLLLDQAAFRGVVDEGALQLGATGGIGVEQVPVRREPRLGWSTTSRPSSPGMGWKGSRVRSQAHPRRRGRTRRWTPRTYAAAEQAAEGDARGR